MLTPWQKTRPYFSHAELERIANERKFLLETCQRQLAQYNKLDDIGEFFKSS